jgi:hypothetical protein
LEAGEVKTEDGKAKNGRVRRESESSGAKAQFLARLVSELKLRHPKERSKQKIGLRRSKTQEPVETGDPGDPKKVAKK